MAGTQVYGQNHQRNESMKANRLGFSYDNHRSMVSRSSYSDAPLFEGFGTQDGDYETEENLKMGHRNYYGGEMSSATYEQNTSYFRSAHATIEQEREISVPGPVIEEFETVEMIPIGQGVQTFRTGHSTPGPRTPQFSGHINSMSNSRTLPSGRPPIQPQRINQANVSRTSSLPPGARNMRRVAQYAPPQSAVSVAHIHHFPDNSTRVCNNPDCLDQLTNQQFGISTSGTFHQERLPPETPIVNHSAKYVAPNIPVFDETDTEVRRGHKFDDWYTGRRRIEALESEPAHLTNFNKIVRDDAPSWNIHMQTDTLSDERNLPITVSNSLQTQSAIPNDTIEPPMKSIDLISMTKKIWYKPDLSREEAFNLLKNCKPGTFVIRSSASFQNSLGLAIKVGQIPEDITPKSTNLEQELVRHYLIEKNKHGVRIRGSPEEPQFRSLEHLIDEHSRKKISLPIILRLPQLPSNMRESPLILPRSELNLGLEVKPPAYNTNSSNRNFTQSSSKMKTLDQIDVSNKPSARPSHIDSAASSDGETFMAYLIGQVHIEQMTGEQGLVQALANIKRDRKLIECRFKVGPDGLLLTDVNRKLFFREHIPWQIVSFFGSTSQRWNIDTNQKSSSVFGFVLKKPREENKAYLFAEMDSPSNVIVNAVSKYLPKTQITAL